MALNSHPDFPPLTASYFYESAEHGEISARFFGTTTILFNDGEDAILIDGFFSRPDKNKILFGRLSPDKARLKKIVECCIPSNLNSIFVAHAHHDHALDAGFIAKLTGATIYGSRSALIVANAVDNTELKSVLNAPLTNQEIIRNGSVYSSKNNKFKVIAIETPHSASLLSQDSIDPDFRFPAKITDFRPGENYSFLIEHESAGILFVTSANKLSDALKGLKADITILSIGGIGTETNEYTRVKLIEEYWNAAVKATGAKVVVPVHWDDFTRPLGETLVAFPYVIDRVDRTFATIQVLAKRDGVAIRFMPTNKVVKLAPQ
ncbi:MBL fold metallo-hydrolase [Methyloversatilis sp. XJ19-49]|uniref:MBL fold metallo-hydrolase n=1 Tax=Methyloversatilis sp. XJ19-49 TaxID=2963429 RepID=UPI00211BD192|nr:MBL fold metallo-hydrolase [Methyloversatilis sp. XJ19-49]